MNNNIFAENLKKFRIAKNLTQEQVAEMWQSRWRKQSPRQRAWS